MTRSSEQMLHMQADPNERERRACHLEGAPHRAQHTVAGKRVTLTFTGSKDKA